MGVDMIWKRLDRFIIYNGWPWEDKELVGGGWRLWSPSNIITNYKGGQKKIQVFLNSTRGWGIYKVIEFIMV